MEELLKVKFGQSPVEVKRVNYLHRIKWDDTQDKVYEMCDTEIVRDRWEKIGKEWDSKKQKIVYRIFNGIDMEKKKMTKAEAFKYLDEAKIYVDGQIEAVLETLFEIGFTWKDGGQQVDLGWSRADEAYGLMIHDGEVCWVDKECCGSWFDNLYAPNEQRAEDVLSIEIVEGTPKFSYEKVVELAKPLMEYLNDTGCTEQIGVCYDHIVAQPMATFLHGEMKGC